MPEVFTIILDETQSGFYNPGSVVSGKILLTLSEPLKTRGIRLKFKAEEKTSWEIGSG
jgi:hypothetical protein